MSTRIKGVFMAAGAAGLWGLMSVFVRKLSLAGFSGIEIAYLRCLLAGGGLLLLNGRKNPAFLHPEKTEIITAVLFGAVVFTGSFLSYSASVQLIPVAMTAVLAFMSPVWVCLIDVFVFHGQVKHRQIVSIGVCIVGAVLITDVIGIKELQFHSVGVLMGLLNGFGVAAQITVPRYFAGKYSRDSMLTYGFLGAAVVMFPFADHGKIATAFAGVNGISGGEILANVMCLSLLCTLVANTAFVKSTCYVGTATTSILSALEVVVGTLVGMFFFNETLSPLQLVGAIIIVIASLGMELWNR